MVLRQGRQHSHQDRVWVRRYIFRPTGPPSRDSAKPLGSTCDSATLKLPYSYLTLRAEAALGSGRGDREGEVRACRFIAETGGPGRAGAVPEGPVRQSRGTVPEGPLGESQGPPGRCAQQGDADRGAVARRRGPGADPEGRGARSRGRRDGAAAGLERIIPPRRVERCPHPLTRQQFAAREKRPFRGPQSNCDRRGTSPFRAAALSRCRGGEIRT